jgi:general secretion pathway protein L
VISQGLTLDSNASERPVGLSASNTVENRLATPSAAMLARAEEFCPKVDGLPARPVAAELVGSFIVNVPKSNARQRQALITFAVEERIAAPLHAVQIVQAPLSNAKPGDHLALVLSNNIMAEIAQADAPHLPEYLLIPRPSSDTGPVWSVWKEGSRAVVRCYDGTGFAAEAAMLPLLWQRAGKPALRSLGEPLGDALPAEDLSDAPPPPDPADAAFSFAQPRHDAARGFAAWKWAAVAVAAALMLHLGFIAFNAHALRQIAEAERRTAEQAIATVLPGMPLTREVGPILSRLTPTQAVAAEGSFLPLLSAVSRTLADAPVGFRRMSWGKTENTLVVLVQSPGLEDLQGVERDLETAGFTVRSGAATAGNGGAEVEMRIGRGAGG